MRRHAKAIVAISALLLTLVLGVSLASAVAPTVTIEDASEVSYQTAKVKGTVDPQGQATSYRFEYLTDALYNTAVDEKQRVVVSATAGTYTLTFQGDTTPPIPFDAPASQLESTLNALSTIGGAGGSVSVTGGPGDKKSTKPYEVVFGGSFTQVNVETMGMDASGIKSGPFQTFVEEVRQGRAVGFDGADTAAEGSTEVPATPEGELTGLKPSTTYHLRLVAENADGRSEAVAASTFTTKFVDLPVLTAPTFSEVEAFKAVVEGTVAIANADPAFSAFCLFEYMPKEDFDEAGGQFRSPSGRGCEPQPVTGSGPQPVAVKNFIPVNGALEPNTVYIARVSAENSGGVAYSPTSTFTTLPTKPEISEASATNVDETAATLAGNVNPRNSAFTDCHFVYGPTASYGQEAPCASLPTGNSERLVSARVQGLNPSSTYHFKLIAANAVGSVEGPDGTFFTAPAGPSPEGSCANEEIRAQQGSQALPSCRAYEMVSPAEKFGGTLMNPPTYAPGQTVMEAIAPNGEGALYWSYQGMADAQSALINSYWATRTDSGWTSTALIQEFPRPGHISVGGKAAVLGASPDFSRFFFSSPLAFDPLDQRPFGFFSGPRDIYGISPGSAATWISRPDGLTADASSFESFWVGSSANGQRVFFQSEERMGAAEENVGGYNLYERDGDQTHLVAVDDNGAALNKCGSILGTYTAAPYEFTGGNGSGQSSLQGAISPSAGRVYFTTPDPDAVRFSSDPECQTMLPELYVREGEHTVEVSRSRRATPDPDPQPAFFQGGSTDGSIVYFASDEALTEDANPSDRHMLYVYDAADDSLELVSDRVAGVSGVSADGSHAYFVAEGPESAKLMVYSREDGSVKTVARSVTERESLSGRSFEQSRTKVTPDGDHALFLSQDNLTEFDSEGKQEAYLYNANTGNLVCVSCAPDGTPPVAETFMSSAAMFGEGSPINRPASHNLSDDGTRAFFETANPLVPADVNGGKDVYEWHRGKISLISDGRDPKGSAFFGASADGRDAFITTATSLVGRDFDRADTDLYDARIDGGFLEPPVPPAPCEGEGCQGQAGAVPADRTATTNSFNGPPNKVERKAQHKKKHKKHKKKRRHQSKARHGKNTTKKGR